MHKQYDGYITQNLCRGLPYKIMMTDMIKWHYLRLLVFSGYKAWWLPKQANGREGEM